jgi:hypothetical protein
MDPRARTTGAVGDSITASGCHCWLVQQCHPKHTWRPNVQTGRAKKQVAEALAPTTREMTAAKTQRALIANLFAGNVRDVDLWNAGRIGHDRRCAGPFADIHVSAGGSKDNVIVT